MARQFYSNKGNESDILYSKQFSTLKYPQRRQFVFEKGKKSKYNLSDIDAALLKGYAYALAQNYNAYKHNPNYKPVPKDKRKPVPPYTFD